MEMDKTSLTNSIDTTVAMVCHIHWFKKLKWDFMSSFKNVLIFSQIFLLQNNISIHAMPFINIFLIFQFAMCTYTRHTFCATRCFGGFLCAKICEFFDWLRNRASRPSNVQNSSVPREVWKRSIEAKSWYLCPLVT